jgi:hypothetical protein
MENVIIKQRDIVSDGKYNPRDDTIELFSDNIVRRAERDGVFTTEYRQLVLYHEMFHRMQSKRYTNMGWNRKGWDWYFETRADRYAIMRYRREVGYVPSINNWSIYKRRRWNLSLILQHKLKGGKNDQRKLPVYME